MIARIWHGRTNIPQADSYVDFLKQTGIPDYLGTDGNRGVLLLRRLVEDEAHFLLISYWDSEQAIRRFAGSDIEKARYYPDDKDYLLEFEPTVSHYEVIETGPRSD